MVETSITEAVLANSALTVSFWFLTAVASGKLVTVETVSAISEEETLSKGLIEFWATETLLILDLDTVVLLGVLISINENIKTMIILAIIMLNLILLFLVALIDDLVFKSLSKVRLLLDFKLILATGFFEMIAPNLVS